MATRTKSTSRTTLVNGCGTILKTNRLKHGYTLVKRKRVVGTSTATAPAKRKAGRPKKVIATATAPKRKAGRPAKAKMVATITEKVVMTAPKRKAGRPAKAKTVATVTAPKRKAGRPAKAKMVATVTAPKRKAGRPKKVMATVLKPSVKATTKRRGKRKSRRTVKA